MRPCNQLKAVIMAPACLVVLSLSACSGEPDTSESPTAAPTREAAPSPEVTGRETSTSDTSELADTSSIPPLLRGRWGLVPLDCTGDPAAAKGLITVSDKRIEFYESLARLDSVETISESALSGSFTFEGEGQTWQLDVSLVSKDGGKTMVRSDSGEDAAPRPLTYTKCS